MSVPEVRKTILHVEDLEDNRDVVRLLVERLGVRLLEARDGAEGIEMAREHLPDLILMDLSLPIVDGWEATRRLKADSRTAHVPVVAVTAHAMKIDEERARAAGCDGYVAKPIDVTSFQKLLREHLRI